MMSVAYLRISLIVRSMPENCRISTVDCELQVLHGSACTLTVQLDWTVATLKEQIEDAMQVPCYLQVLSDTNRKLLNKDKLRDVYVAQDSVETCLSLFLCYLEPPSQLGQAEVQRAWEAFRLYSTDYGDTIPPISLPEVMRYLQLQAGEGDVEDILIDREKVSFAEVLSVMATRKDASINSEPKEFGEDDCYVFDSEDAWYRNGQDEGSYVAALIESIRIRRQNKSCKSERGWPVAQRATSCNAFGVSNADERLQTARSTDRVASSTLISL
eukprot:TRINITY_DN14138_c0_g1_i3.p1 TRINITY_DN14138_c0_g1~~TRINITY_DN14138_c0_g1_i3.p1  ORF type:complete len:271 (+),score=33.79 TRINITY_DN14138_c0_g1_i3:141-953(+)